MATAVVVTLVLVVIFALAFDFTNGFHDSANAIATVVSTGVLPLRVAVIMAGILNGLGAFVSTRVAETIASGLVDPRDATDVIVLAAVLGAIAWNILTWYFGIPSSSSHALIGGLCGAAIAAAGFNAVMWKGVVDKVVLPLVGSPLVGFGIGFVLMTIVFVGARHMRPAAVEHVFRHLQVLTAMTMAFAHGANDAQKSMGIITMALVSTHYLSSAVVPDWVIMACAAAMALGTMSGGTRIIKTMGEKIIKLEPINGFAAEASAAAVIFGTAAMGMPVSTTHVIAGSIFGVGLSKSITGTHEKYMTRAAIEGMLAPPRHFEKVAKRRAAAAAHEHGTNAAISGVASPTSRESAESGASLDNEVAREAAQAAAQALMNPKVRPPLRDDEKLNWLVAQQMVVAWILTLPASALVAGVLYAGLHAVLGR